MPPFPGALPPQLTGAPPNAGAATAPHGTPGNSAADLSKIKLGLEALQAGLPGVPMGTELHDAVLKAISTIGKHMSEMQDSPQMKMQGLLSMLQKMKQQQPNAALAGMGAPSPAGGPPPGATMPPPPPIPGAPPGAA